MFIVSVVSLPHAALRRYGARRADRGVCVILDCDDSEMPCALTSVVRSSLNAIIVVDETGRIVDFNAAAERTFGQSRTDMIGRSASDQIVQSPLHPDDRHRIRAFFTGRAPGESAVRGRIDWRGGGGALIPIEATITEVKLDGDSRFICSLRDLSGERHADEELQESRRRLELAVEGAKIGIWTYDLETGETWYSDRSKQMYGLPLDTAMDASVIRNAVHPDHWDEVADPYLHGFTADKVEVEYRVVCPDGSTHWIYSLGAVNRDRDGAARTVNGIHLDITDRKKAEEELSQARLHLEMAVDGANLGIWRLDPRTGDAWYSDRSRNLWGVDHELHMDAETIWTFVHPDDRDKVLEPYRSGFPSDRIDLEHRVVWPNGDVRWVHSIGTARRDASGEVVSISGIHLDVTDRKAAEAELAKSREALHQSEKLAALGSLLAGVSHELNNPLSAIVGQAEMLEEDALGTPLEARAKKISAAADRCARIVQTFLAMARRREPDRVAIDPNSLVTDALQITEYALRTTGIAATVECDPHVPAIEGDRDQLHQVLVNLIINAQQALEGAETFEKRLCVRTCVTAAGKVAIDVVDNGPGIPEDLLGRIFEPFFTTKPQGSGTGVGLSFSFGIVAAHGGSLSLLPAEQGATFRIELPAAAPVSVEIVPEEQPGSAPITAVRRRALVVDDEADIADTIRELLEREGFDVVVAQDGGSALRALDRGEFDVVLSDLRMPGVSGPEMYARLKEVRPQLLDRIAFVTGDTLGASMDAFLRESGRPVLEKPFTRAGVRCLVQALIEK
jgi:PAS domain S-box-containing protein